MEIQCLWAEPVQDKLSPTDSPAPKRSLLPFLGDALQWLTGTGTIKDTTERARTEKTAGNLSTHNFHPKHYIICHPSE